MERGMPSLSEIESFKQNMKQPEILERPGSNTPDSLEIIMEQNRRTAHELDLLLKKSKARRKKEVSIAAVLATIAIGAGIKITDAFASGDSTSKDDLVSLELAPDAKVNINYESLRELDSEFTPERVDAILGTLPQGFITGEVSSIEFNKDAESKMGEQYGKEMNDKGKAVASTKGGWKKTGADIDFLATSKGYSSAYNVRTLIHEIGHANAFDTLRNLTNSERIALEKKLIIRLEDPNRFQSAYVEDIPNERKVKEDEYWAEIFEAYINKKQNLPTEDAVLVAEVIAAKDPNFDRDEQLRRRNIEVMAMMEGELQRALDNLSPVMQGRHQVWLDNHKDKLGHAIDQKKQKLGRAELVSFLQVSLNSDDQVAFINQYISFCEKREELLSEGANFDLKDLLPYAQFVDEKIPKSLEPEKAKELLDKVEAIINKYDLVIGKHRDAHISQEEQKELTSVKHAKILDITYNLLSEFNS